MQNHQNKPMPLPKLKWKRKLKVKTTPKNNIKREKTNTHWKVLRGKLSTIGNNDKTIKEIIKGSLAIMLLFMAVTLVLCITSFSVVTSRTEQSSQKVFDTNDYVGELTRATVQIERELYKAIAVMNNEKKCEEYLVSTEQAFLELENALQGLDELMAKKTDYQHGIQSIEVINE